MQRRSEHGHPVPVQLVPEPRPTGLRGRRRTPPPAPPTPTRPDLAIRRRPVRADPGRRVQIVEPDEQFGQQRRRGLSVAPELLEPNVEPAAADVVERFA